MCARWAQWQLDSTTERSLRFPCPSQLGLNKRDTGNNVFLTSCCNQRPHDKLEPDPTLQFPLEFDVCDEVRDQGDATKNRRQNPQRL